MRIPFCTDSSALSEGTEAQIDDICPHTVQISVESVVLITGTGLSSVDTVFVDGEPVPATPLSDRLLHVFVPMLQEGTHTVTLGPPTTTTTAPTVTGSPTNSGQTVTLIASDIGFPEATDTAVCFRNIVNIGLGDGLIFESRIASSFTKKAEAIERALQANNANAAIPQYKALLDQILRSELHQVATSFGEAVAAILNASMREILLDVGRRGTKTIKDVVFSCNRLRLAVRRGRLQDQDF